MSGQAEVEAAPEISRRTSVALLLAALVALAAWALFLANRAPGTAAALVGLPLDDAWIHLVYARSLATEGGFHYNPGVAEAGMTSPLWVVLAAAVHLVAAPFGAPALVFGVKVLALALGIGCVWTLHALARTLGLAPWASLLAAFLCAVDPALTFSRAAGMEVPLFTLLVLLAILFALRGELIATAFATGLALVARPEAALIVPTLVVVLALVPFRKGITRARVAIATALAGLPSLAYAAFCLAVTGRPLPNSFYAKFVEPGRSTLASLILGWRDYVLAVEPYFTLEAGSLLALFGVAALVARRGLRGFAVLGAGALLFVGTLATRNFSAGHFHYWERWLIPSYPFLLLAMAAGADTIVAWISRQARAPWGARLAGAILLGLLFFGVPSALSLRAREFAWNCQNIEEMNVALGRWVERNVTPDGVIAVIDAGALRFFGNRETVDLFGLNDYRIRGEKGIEAQVAYLKSRRVEWLVLVPEGAAQMIETLQLEPQVEVSAPTYTISGARQGRMVVYRWPPAVG